MPMPLTSWKPASGPSVLPVPRSTRKLNCTYGRSRRTAMSPLSQASAPAVRGPLTDAEDDEFGRPQRRDTDLADQAPVVEIVLRHRRAIAAYEERLLGLVAEQRTHLPFVQQEVLDRAPHVGPQLIAVRLEDRPLRALVDGVFEIDEVAAQVHILPFRVGADRSRPPQPVTAPFEEPEAVDPLRIQHVLLRLVQ